MGCKVVKNRHGRLALQVHWNGQRSWEGAGLEDTKANRAKLVRVAAAIHAEIRAKEFTAERYLHYFPNGNRSQQLGLANQQETAAKAVGTIGEYYEGWIRQHQPPLVRVAQARDYRQHLERYVLDSPIGDAVGGLTFRDLALKELKPSHLRYLMSRLLKAELKPKTVKNIIGASFRALVRDARSDELVSMDPFRDLKWPTGPKSVPDPLSERERDRILRWFAKRRPSYAPFVFTLFHTGMRPSEATALRWGDVDLLDGRLSIQRSRYLGGESATKTVRRQLFLPIDDN